MAEITITQDNIQEEVIKSEVPVLLDFWAAWCGPCKMTAPAIALIAEEYEGKLKVGKVNVDEQPGLAYTFEVSSVPLMVLIKDGAIVAETIGYQPKEQIEHNLRLAEFCK